MIAEERIEGIVARPPRARNTRSPAKAPRKKGLLQSEINGKIETLTQEVWQAMKRWISMLLALMMCLALCACGAKDSGASSGAEEASGQMSDASEAQAALLEKEDIVALAERYFDLSQYSEELTVLDGIMDLELGEVLVDGEPLSFGMSYDEVTALGFRPEETGFEDINPWNTIRSGQFKTPDGKLVSLGFMGEGAIKTHGKLVTIGTYAFESDAGKLAEISIDDLTVGMPVTDAKAVCGDPDYMQKGAMGGGTALMMGYFSEDGNQKLKVYIDPANAAVVGIEAQDIA